MNSKILNKTKYCKSNEISTYLHYFLYKRPNGIYEIQLGYMRLNWRMRNLIGYKRTNWGKTRSNQDYRTLI